MRSFARAAFVVAALCAATPVVRAQGASDRAALLREALTRETAVRRDLAASRPASAGPALQRLRTLVGAFQDLARLFPTAGLADKALWQGANLSADAFWQFGGDADRTTALTLLDALTAGFPGSSFARLAPALSNRLASAPVPERTPAPAAPPTPRTTTHTPSRLPAVITPLAKAVETPVLPPADSGPAVETRLAPERAAAARTAARAPAAPLATRSAAKNAKTVPPPAVARTESPASPAVMLTSVRRELTSDAARVILELDREVSSYHTERIEKPDRVFIDLSRTRVAETLKGAVLPFADDVVRRIRIGAHEGQVTRVVLDLEGSGRHSIYTLYDPYRIVVDIERPRTAAAPALLATAVNAPPPPLAHPPRPAVMAATVAASTAAPALHPARPAPVAATSPATLAAAVAPPPRLEPPSPAVPSPAPPLASTSTAVSSATAPPSAAPAATSASIAPAGAARTPEPDVAPFEVTPPAPPSVNARGGFSMSRQLGLGIARVVIDAGHGGHDPGAKIKGGLSEADLVLDVALRLEKLLTKQPGVEVIQTRRANAYVSLEERTEIANRSGADLFLSIHANASEDERARGVETYFLNFAPNAEAEAIAARENAGSNRQMRQLPEIVKAIAMNNKIDESRELATMVQQALFTQARKSDRRARNLGVKQAPFVVLVGAAMPSVLTEISFVTNQQDAGLLATEKYRQQVAEALLAGVTRYQQSLKKATAVATQ